MDKPFKIHSKFQPTGDQPQAIEKIVDGFQKGLKFQTLVGVTGSGKTFTMANVIVRNYRNPRWSLPIIKPLLPSFTANLRNFSRKMLWNTSLVTMITISRRPMCPAPIPISRRIRQSMTKSINCATLPHRHWLSEKMFLLLPVYPVSTVWVTRKNIWHDAFSPSRYGKRQG